MRETVTCLIFKNVCGRGFKVRSCGRGNGFGAALTIVSLKPQTTPCATIASATFLNPAIFAPVT